jgi:hypothetical protein
MADVTISGLSPVSPNKNSAIIPFSDGSTTYRTAPSGIVAASPGTVIQTICLNNAGAGVHSQSISSGKGATFNTLTITPSFSTSKILIQTGTAMTKVTGNLTDRYTIKLRRGSVVSGYVVDAAPVLCQLADTATYNNSIGQRDTYYVTYLDSPSATSPTTYSLYVSAVALTNPVDYASFNQGNCGYMMLQEIAG